MSYSELHLYRPGEREYVAEITGGMRHAQDRKEIYLSCLDKTVQIKVVDDGNFLDDDVPPLVEVCEEGIDLSGRKYRETYRGYYRRFGLDIDIVLSS